MSVPYPHLRTRADCTTSVCSCRSSWRGSAWWSTQYHWKCLPTWKQHMSFLLVLQWPKPARWSHTSSRGRGFAGKYNATICSENKHKDTWWRTLMNSIIAGSQIYEGDSDIRQSKTDRQWFYINDSSHLLGSYLVPITVAMKIALYTLSHWMDSRILLSALSSFINKAKRKLKRLCDLHRVAH